MKPYLKFKKDNTEYRIEEFSHGTLDLIFYFLTDHSIDALVWSIPILRDPEQHNMSFNFCHIYKEDQEHVILSSLYEDQVLMGEVRCSAEQLVKLIEGWKKAVEQKPEYIYISQETNGNFTVTTSDANS